MLQPLSIKATVWAIAAFVALVIIFLFLAPFARKETVAGYLMPTAGTARVYAPQPGIVSAVQVQEGQDVEEGQPLLSVTTAQVAADGQDVNLAMLDALVRQRDLLTRQIPAEEVRTRSERERLAALIQGLEAEAAHIEGQMATQRERIRLMEGLVAVAARLNPRGYVSDLEYRRREEALLEQRQNLDVLGQQARCAPEPAHRAALRARAAADRGGGPNADPARGTLGAGAARSPRSTAAAPMSSGRRLPAASPRSRPWSGGRRTRASCSSASSPTAAPCRPSCSCRPAPPASSGRASGCASSTRPSPTRISAPMAARSSGSRTPS